MQNELFNVSETLNKPIKTTILDMAEAKFKIGEQVLHPRYGICRITAARGAMRSVSAPAIGEARVRIIIRNVHVNELNALTPLPA